MSARSIFEGIVSDQWPGLVAWQNSREEGVHLEFKEKADPRKPEIEDADQKVLAKAISGFANTEGGVIVFGARTTKSSRSRPDRLSTLERIAPLGRAKERLGAIIRELTDPVVAATRIEAIEDPGHPDSGILAVFIPESDGGPHRAARGDVQGRYFMRTDDDTVVMPHSLLAAMFGRSARSRLRLTVVWNGARGNLGFNLRLSNAGRGAARQPAIQILLKDTGIGTFQWHLARPTINDWLQSGSHVDGGEAWLFRSPIDVIIYPGLEIDVVYATARGANDLSGPFRLEGYVYAEQAPRIRFSREVNIGHSETFSVPEEE